MQKVEKYLRTCKPFAPAHADASPSISFFLSALIEGQWEASSLRIGNEDADMAAVNEVHVAEQYRNANGPGPKCRKISGRRTNPFITPFLECGPLPQHGQIRNGE